MFLSIYKYITGGFSKRFSRNNNSALATLFSAAKANLQTPLYPDLKVGAIENS